ncbi:4-alpha-glucanotransferase [bacterium]|nr:4-alpha-glucanotransferase [bacterium]
MEQQQKRIIKEALNALGKKNLAFICHAGSFPSEYGKDTGFGNAVSNSAKKLIDYLSGIFNAIQLGPAGKTKSCDASPYTGTIFSNNPLFIDLEQLTTDEFYNLLSKETYQNICDNNPNKDKNRTAYSYIYSKQEEALKEAYNTFKKTNPFKLVEALEKYKKDNVFWLEKDAIYEALSIENGNDYWPIWKNEDDKNLFNPKNEEEKVKFEKRINEIKEKYADEIEFYAFKQLIASIQNAKIKDYALSKDIKMIADRQVAFSDRDVWAYQSLFLDGWFLGCPPDLFSDNGQAWGFPVINPDKMYNADGSLGDAGKLMKALFKKMFVENPGGVRIDHLVGLIDPWVYKAGKTPKPEDGAGRLYSSPEHEFLKKFAIATLDDLNEEVTSDMEKRVKSLTPEQIKLYGRLIEKIVIGAAEEVGLNKDAIVCEDLGTVTYPVESVMKQYGLQGMCLTQFVVPEEPEHAYRCKNIKPKSWVMVGTHDNQPISVWADNIVNTHEGYLNGKNLAEDLYPDSTEEEQEQIAVRLSKEADFMLFNKLVEIFACKAENVQIFFTDFFGLKETYNIPGTSGDANWSLRIPNNYEEIYEQNLKNGGAINLPVLLKQAIISRGKDFAEKYSVLIEQLERIS